MNAARLLGITALLAPLALATPAVTRAQLHPRALTLNRGVNLYPLWLADNHTLVFSTGRNTTFSGFTLWQTSADTDTAMQMTWGDWTDGYTQLSPDGTKLLMMSNRGGEFNLVMRPVDADTCYNVADPKYRNMYPYWFKDGRRVLYMSVRDSLANLVVRDLASGAEKVIYSTRTPIYYPCLSPDESTVYFSAGVQGIQYDIFHVPVGGGEPQVWNSFPGQKLKPTFTPDGRHILFIRGDERGSYSLYIASADSGSTARKIDSGLSNAYYPAFSRDGKWLAFCSKDDVGDVDIYIAPWTGEEVRDR